MPRVLVTAMCAAVLAVGVAVPAMAASSADNGSTPAEHGATRAQRGHAADVPDPTPSKIPRSSWKAYRGALFDSAIAEEDEVVTNLVTLDRSDSRLQWRTIDGHDYVLMGTIRSNALAAEGAPVTLEYEKWVSAPWQLEAKCAASNCAKLSSADLDQRLKQILGLPPDGDYRVINRLWVRPEDMFRPCTSPSLASTTCPTQVVTGGFPDTVLGTALNAFLWGQTNYAWRAPSVWAPDKAVSCVKKSSDRNCYGFPWTRLGYTYDWAKGDREVGVSEFVVARGATVYIDKVRSQRYFFPAKR